MSTVTRSRRCVEWGRWPAIIAVLLILTVALPVVAPPTLARDRVGVATQRLHVWRERDKHAEVLLTIPRDTEIIVTGRSRRGFYPVRVDDVEGWALTGSVAIAVDDGTSRRGGQKTLGSDRDRSAGRTFRGFATDAVNLRSGPSTGDRSHGVIPAGRELTLTGEERDGFVGASFGGATGWIAKEFVESDRPLSRDAAPKPVLEGNPRHMSPAAIVPFIYAAADYYGQPREDMLRVAQCESDLVPMAVNAEGGSYGIFQFKTGTWLSTPYAEYDIFDPRASAYAAGWMWSVGRRNEWVCQ